jgi:hypothetical protein
MRSENKRTKTSVTSEPSGTTIRTNQIVNVYNIINYSPVFLNLAVNIELK